MDYRVTDGGVVRRWPLEDDAGGYQARQTQEGNRMLLTDGLAGSAGRSRGSFAIVRVPMVGVVVYQRGA